MPLFSEGESEAVLVEKDLEQEQRRIGFGRRGFGAMAIMMSSRRAEKREARALERERTKVTRREKRYRIAQKMHAMTRRMIMNR